MRINVQVALGRNGEIKPSVTCQLLKHVVVERDTGRDRRSPRSVEVDGHINGCLFCVACDLGCTCHVSILAASRPSRTVNYVIFG